MSEMNMTIGAGSVTPSAHVDGGWDCDVELTLDGLPTIDLEVTLIPSDKGPCSWGSLDNWMAPAGLEAFDRTVKLAGCGGLDLNQRDEVLRAIVRAARAAILASGVEMSEVRA